MVNHKEKRKHQLMYHQGEKIIHQMMSPPGQSPLYSGRQKYSARSAKVAHILRAITTVPNKKDRSSFFYLKDLGGLYTYRQLHVISYKFFWVPSIELTSKKYRFSNY
jgi:hypothetical protein